MLPPLTLPLHLLPTREVLKKSVKFHWRTIKISLCTSILQSKGISYLPYKLHNKKIYQSWTLTLARTFSNWTTYRKTCTNSCFRPKNLLSQWIYPKLALSTTIWSSTRIIYFTYRNWNKLALSQWISLKLTISDPILQPNGGAYLSSTIYTKSLYQWRSIPTTAKTNTQGIHSHYLTSTLSPIFLITPPSWYYFLSLCYPQLHSKYWYH